MSFVTRVGIEVVTEELEKKRLYSGFDANYGSYETFCKLIEGISKDHIESDQIPCFWYKPSLSNWKFGDKEYRK